MNESSNSKKYTFYKQVFKIILMLLLSICTTLANAQLDTNLISVNSRLKNIEKELTNNPVLKKNYDDLTFYYGQMMKYKSDSMMNAGFKISGYIDAYYAHYSDRLPLGEFQKFPTSAPISNTFGLNMAMVQFQYQNENLNGIISLHTGDIARSAWSVQYNFIQEAHLGVKLMKKLWLESGFFRTHLGFESIQPRENIGSTIALTTYFEPYFLSGAKLTYYINPKVNVMLGAFNGFNSFVAVNSHKTYGISMGYDINKKLSMSFNSLLSNESKSWESYERNRLYSDLYLTYKSKRIILGFESNFGVQTHSMLTDSTKTALMYSITAAAKYKFNNGKYSLYTRGEIFNDNNEILTGPILNSYHQLVGVNAIGFNLGAEYKAKSNTFLRFEGRFIHLKNKENIFNNSTGYSNLRWEWVSAMGVWF